MAFTLELDLKVLLLSLQETNGSAYRLSEFDEPKVLVIPSPATITPYVIGSDEMTRQTAKRFALRGVDNPRDSGRGL